MLFAGTAVVAGRAVAVVVAVGDDTVAGRGAAGAGAPPTGVEHRLQQLAAHATRWRSAREPSRWRRTSSGAVP